MTEQIKEVIKLLEKADGRFSTEMTYSDGTKYYVCTPEGRKAISKALAILKQEPCKTCGGTKKEYGDPYGKPCPDCQPAEKQTTSELVAEARNTVGNVYAGNPNLWPSIACLTSFISELCDRLEATEKANVILANGKKSIVAENERLRTKLRDMKKKLEAAEKRFEILKLALKGKDEQD